MLLQKHIQGSISESAFVASLDRASTKPRYQTHSLLHRIGQRGTLRGGLRGVIRAIQFRGTNNALLRQRPCIAVNTLDHHQRPHRFGLTGAEVAQ